MFHLIKASAVLEKMKSLSMLLSGHFTWKLSFLVATAIFFKTLLYAMSHFSHEIRFDRRFESAPPYLYHSFAPCSRCCTRSRLSPAQTRDSARVYMLCTDRDSTAPLHHTTLLQSLDDSGSCTSTSLWANRNRGYT